MKGRIGLATFLLCMLGVCTGGGCALHNPDDLTTHVEHPLSLALSFKNVLPGQENATKMTAEVTQSGGIFRGIEQMYVIPFNTEYFRVEPADSRLGSQNVVLGRAGISQSGLVANNNAHLFGSAFVPSGMDCLLAYGKALDEGENASKDSRHTYGVLIPQGLEDPSGSDDISFHLMPILSTGENEDELTAAGVTAEGLLEQLNVVMTMMGSSQNASILKIHDDVRRENNILACSYPTFDQIRTEIQSALIRIPFETMDLVEEIGRISQAVSAFSTLLTEAGATFPASYGIPEGSFGFWWNGTAFVRLINGVNVAMVNPASYCYPPGLWYYANSSVRTSNKEDVLKQYVETHDTWEDILDYYSDGPSVNAFTESVAIEDPLEYGEGMLELKLANPGAEALTLLKDCPLTGVIIGDQKDVDFRFLPGLGQSRYVYDNVVGDLKIGSTDGTLQTLVLQTVDGAPVHFALEFKNTTGRSIPCQQGEILPRCKFYLAGVLDPPAGVTLPSGEVIYSVFSRDHKTTVTVAVEGVRNAYNTVPDLHSPQLEIGVVTEMKWNQLTPQSVELVY